MFFFANSKPPALFFYGHARLHIEEGKELVVVQPNLSEGGAQPVQEMLEGGPSCMTRIEIFPAILFPPLSFEGFPSL